MDCPYCKTEAPTPMEERELNRHATIPRLVGAIYFLGSAGILVAGVIAFLDATNGPALPAFLILAVYVGAALGGLTIGSVLRETRLAFVCKRCRSIIDAARLL